MAACLLAPTPSVDGGAQPPAGPLAGPPPGLSVPRLPAEPPRNALFEQCYRGAVVPEDEWPEFMEALRRDLPVTFRFAVGHPLAGALEAHLEREFLGTSLLEPPGAAESEAAEAEAEPETQAKAQAKAQARGPPLGRLRWTESAWRLDLPKATLRKAPGPRRLHGFLKRCTELGAICRQEAVSMVPVALLRAAPRQRVLDLCAAPGMKTLQLLDLVTRAAAQAPDAAAAGTAILRAGAVVANEFDGRRCCMLAHHVLRVRHPAGLVLHYDAAALPPLGGGFERVLCDVPCSGDGTIRKAPQLLAGWRPNRANALHRLQLRLACAGAARLAAGGRMVFSTCALNPVENEAVVAALVLRAEGALELVDCAGDFPELPRRPGLEHWQVPAGARQCRTAVVLQTPAEATARGLDIPASAWPPEGEAAARAGLPGVLRRCWRFLPHVGDGGGFFVAVLHRTETRLPRDFELPPPAAEPVGPADSAAVDPVLATKRAAEESELLPEEAVCKEAVPASQREAALASADEGDRTRALLEHALVFYGLEDLPVGNFFVRNDGDGRNVYLVSDAVRNILRGLPGLRTLVGGVRVFDENRFLKSSGCRLRLAQEGVRWLAPLMRRRRCEASPEEMLGLLEGNKVSFASFSAASPLRRSLEAMELQGSVAVACTLSAGASVCATAERGAECISLFVNQHEMRELRESLREFLVPVCA